MLLATGRSNTGRPLALMAILAAIAALALLLASTLLTSAPTARAVTINPCAISPEECATLTISPIGDGFGFVQSTSKNGTADGFISCVEGAGYVTGTCSHQYFVGIAGTTKTLYLYVAPQAGSKRCDIFNSCSTTANLGTADIVSGINRTVTVDFELVNPARLRVGTTGTGDGTITSQPVGIDCGTKCHSDFSVGTSVTLTVTPASDSTFRGWSIGPCHGQGAVCTFSIPADETITAEVVGPAPTPSPTPKPTATPKPTPKPSATPKASPGASAPATEPATTEAPAESQTEFPAPSAPGVTAAPQDSSVPIGAGPTTQPTSGDINPSGASGGADLTPLIVVILFVGLVIAGAVYLGLSRQKRPA